MRRMEKEFQKKAARYEKKLQEFGVLENEMWQVSGDEKRSKNLKKYWPMDTVGGYYFLNLDNKCLELLGLVEITMYHDDSFEIGNTRVPFYINDLHSMQQLLTIFYGTPFDLNLERIRSVDFVRYAITLPEIKAKDFSKLLIYVKLLNECLHQVHEKVVYN